jgi:hypothetical protein
MRPGTVSECSVVAWAIRIGSVTVSSYGRPGLAVITASETRMAATGQVMEVFMRVNRDCAGICLAPGEAGDP